MDDLAREMAILKRAISGEMEISLVAILVLLEKFLPAYYV